MKSIGYAIAILVAAIGLYVGAYYALVDRVGHAPRRSSIWPTSVVARYAVGGDAVNQFFWPAHQIDRRIRPKFWSLADYLRLDLDHPFLDSIPEDRP